LIHVTSHVREGTRHQTGLAMDLRIYDKENPENDPLFKFMAYDLSRQDKKIAILNPFHGTAPHTHISFGSTKEMDYDVLYGTKQFPNTTRDWTLPKEHLHPEKTPAELMSEFTSPTNVDNNFLKEFEEMKMKLAEQEKQVAENDVIEQRKNALLEKQQKRGMAMDLIKD